MQINSKLRRILALFFSMVLAFGLIPISALADSATDTQRSKQIVAAGGTNYYHADGSSGTSLDHDVMVSKTVSATGTENLFNVDVKVQYKDSTTTTVNSDVSSQVKCTLFRQQMHTFSAPVF